MKTKSFFAVFSKLDALIAGVALSVLVFLTFLGVIMRFAFNNPIVWLEEVQFILVLQMAFWGGSAVFESKGHIAIEFLVELFPPKVQRAFEIFIACCVLSVLVFVTYQQFSRSMDLYALGRSTSILRIPFFMNYGGVAFACLFMIYKYIIFFVGSLRSGPSEGSEEV